MMAERWERLNELFHAAAQLPPPARAAFLADECADDAVLREEAERLVSARDSAGQFIEEPAIVSIPLLRESEPRRTRVGRQLGAYRIVSELARGGMGAVYLAERTDGQYEQRVAIKLIKRGMDLDLVVQRFRAERQILASLQHPNIARLLDGGTSDDGEPYFVMEYIEGTPLDEYARGHELAIGERLHLFLNVCEAVAYAHVHRVIHRDIKPANILVTPEGVPKLLDFGIAKTFEPGAHSGTTAVTAFRVLTPQYASPEQVEGRQATMRSDVYSLGVVLYELLTDCSPYGERSADPLTIADAVRTLDPQRPSTAAQSAGVRRQLRGDLDMIVLKALRKEPDRRHRSVDDLASDIARHMEGLPVSARPDTIRYRAGKFLRRNRAPLLAAGTTAILLLGTGFVGLSATGDRWSEPLLALARARERVLLGDDAGPVFVGPVQSLAGGEIDLARSLPGMLTDALSRAAGVKVMDRFRALELHARRGTLPENADAAAVAARDARAVLLLTGMLRPTADSGYVLRLTVSRVAEAREERSIVIEGRSAAQLLNSAVNALVGTRRAPPTTQLMVNRQWDLRERGFRALAAGDPRAAYDHFAATAAHDTTDAVAWYYAQEALDRFRDVPPRELLRRSVAMAHTVTPVERLRILVRWAQVMGDPALPFLADSLLHRSVNDPATLRAWALSRTRIGDFTSAIPVLWRAFELDRQPDAQSSVGCTVCSTLEGLVAVYLYADSLDSAVRLTQDLARWEPREARHWRLLGQLLSTVGRDDDAAAARARAVALQPDDSMQVRFETVISAVERGRYEAADRELEKLAASKSADERIDALWWLAVSLRQQGRYREALAAIRRLRAIDPRPSATILLHDGQLRGERGDWRAAAALFDSAARVTPPLRDDPSAHGRHLAWTFAHKARALAEIGDTVELAALTDSVRNFGAMSYWGRDQRLHHYLRARLLAARGDTAGAMAAYRASIYSPRVGFTRANYELARLLLAVGKPEEAISMLRPPLRGGREAANLYITATELHELLALAYEMKQQPDSAAVHYAAVARAWRSADPPLRARAAYARARAIQLAAGPAGP